MHQMRYAEDTEFAKSAPFGRPFTHIGFYGDSVQDLDRSRMSLPPLNATTRSGLTTLTELRAYQPPFTFKPVATKAQKYAKLVKIDRLRVQRPKAHFVNALKTTEGLETVSKQLEMRLERLEGRSGGISFERLSAFRDAFDDVVKLTQAFCPQLKQIRDIYNEHILFMLSQQEDSGKLYVPGPPMTPPRPCHGDREDLARLKKRVHQLEVESRVLLHENDRLSEVLSEEASFHKEELARIHEEGEDDIADVLDQPRPPKDYASRVEDLQEEIMQKQAAISKEYQSRKGSVPLTVCHNLEQCLREVEIETQKRQRRNQHLQEELKECEERLQFALQERHLRLESDLGTLLGLT